MNASILRPAAPTHLFPEFEFLDYMLFRTLESLDLSLESGLRIWPVGVLSEAVCVGHHDGQGSESVDEVRRLAPRPRHHRVDPVATDVAAHITVKRIARQNLGRVEDQVTEGSLKHCVKFKAFNS